LFDAPPPFDAAEEDDGAEKTFLSTPTLLEVVDGAEQTSLSTPTFLEVVDGAEQTSLATSTLLEVDATELEDTAKESRIA
jgi:hypothetical protein